MNTYEERLVRTAWNKFWKHGLPLPVDDGIALITAGLDVTALEENAIHGDGTLVRAYTHATETE